LRRYILRAAILLSILLLGSFVVAAVWEELRVGFSWTWYGYGAKWWWLALPICPFAKEVVETPLTVAPFSFEVTGDEGIDSHTWVIEEARGYPPPSPYEKLFP